MITYKFQIDKDAAFANWVQGLVKWGWYFSRKEYEHNTKTPFTEPERVALQRLKGLLGRDDTGFVFLWDRYQGKPIINERDRKDWEYISEVFQDRFEKIWAAHFPKLEAWRERLEHYGFKEEHDILQRAATILGLGKTFERVIAVKLLLHYSEEHLSGHTKKEVDNLFIFKISLLKHEYLSKLSDILMHETIHILQNSSPFFEDLLNDAYTAIIKPLGIERHNPSWRHLFYESFASSIVGHGLKLGKEISKTPFVDEYLNEIHSAALNISPLTLRYMEERKALDSTYLEAFMNVWKEVVR